MAHRRITGIACLATAAIAAGLARDVVRAKGTFARQEAGDLHVLTIGIDSYERSHGLPDLRFAKADARALAAALGGGGRGTHPRVFTRVLVDEGATGDSILSALEQIVASATPDDTFVFAYAGYGTRTSDPAATGKAADFVLLTGEGKGQLEGTALKSRLRQIQARNKLIVLDSCYSGLFLDDTAAAAALEGGATQGTAARSNLVLLGTDGMAFETPTLGHGYMTAALLDGLKGPADADRDGAVTARELEAYMPFRLLQIRGTVDMRPRSSSLGEDFKLVRMERQPPRETQPPEIRISSPAIGPGAAVKASPGPVSIAGRAIDLAGVKSVSVNGSRVPLERDGSFAARLFAASEPTVVEIVAEDINQNASSLVLTLEGDLPMRGSPQADLGPGRGGEPLPEPAQSTPAPRRDHALLFATDEYAEWDKLKNPTFDADKIAERLRDTYGFDTRVVPNPDHATILNTLIEYQQRTYGPDDQLLVFMAGHGFYDRRWSDGFLVARNSPRQMTTANYGTFLQHASVFRMIDAIPCAHILLVVDACFGGQMLERAPLMADLSGRREERWRRPAAAGVPVLFRAGWQEPAPAPSVTYPGASDDELIRRKLRGKTRRLFTSGGQEYVPDGRPGHHSPFAARFIEALASRGQGDGLLTTDELYGYLERVAPEPRRGRFTADSVGDFVFVSRPPATPAP